MPTRFHNATVWTSLGTPLQTELKVEHGLVTSNEAISAEQVDCRGQTILPAFIDGHSHPSFAARHLLGPDVTACRTIAQVTDKVERWMDSTPDQDWVVGGSYDRSMAKEGIFESAWLDSSAHNRPVVLHASDHHSIWVNSAALERAGLSASPRGHGTFFEDQEKSLILRHIPTTPSPVFRAAIQDSLQTMLSLGIVATLDAWIDDETRDAYLELDSPVEVDLAHWITQDNWRQSNFEGTNVKFFIDGVLGSATACVSEGYLNGVASGTPVWNTSELAAALEKFASRGCRLHLHAIGDGAVDVALGLLAKIECKIAPVLVHAEILRDDQIAIIAAMKIWVCTKPLWARVDSLSVGALSRLSEQQQSQLYRNRDLIDAGGMLAFGSDWPVSDVNPLLGMYTAIHRDLGGNPATLLNKNQALTLDESIDAYTSKAARMLGLERTGNLNVGSSADFVVLDKNPFLDDGQKLPETKVTAVYLAGIKVFSND